MPKYGWTYYSNFRSFFADQGAPISILRLSLFVITIIVIPFDGLLAVAGQKNMVINEWLLFFLYLTGVAALSAIIATQTNKVCEFWTADERLVNSLKNKGNVKLLGELS